MDYEQKYKKLVKAIKEFRDINSHDEGLQNWISDNVPELAESEDERIRKALIAYFQNFPYDTIEESGTNPEEAIAWLEKQGESKAHGIWFNTKDITAPSERDIIGWYRRKGKLELSPKIVWFCSEEEARKEAEENNDCFLVYWAELPERNFEKNYWFEKQGSKPQGKTALEAVKEEKVDNVNKVVPKFNIGDWIVWQDKYYKVNYNGCGYELVDQNGLSTSLEYGTIDENAHLWTIADAKEGDMLASECCYSIILFRDIEDNNIQFYCDYDFSDTNVQGDRFEVNNNGQHYGSVEYSEDFHPATKEQRDTLMMAMTDAGYRWNTENKQLNKIES